MMKNPLEENGVDESPGDHHRKETEDKSPGSHHVSHAISGPFAAREFFTLSDSGMFVPDVLPGSAFHPCIVAHATTRNENPN
jgi:hypothetical protein